MNKEEIKAKIMEKDVAPSAEALARKEKSIAKLKQREVPFVQHLPVIEDSQSAKKRTKEEIAHRAIALCLVAARSEAGKVDDLIARYRAKEFLTPLEKKFAENSDPTQQERVQFNWRYECHWVMLWALGYVEKLDFPSEPCDTAKAMKILQGLSTEDFVAKTRLRSLSEILDEADLIYRYHWAVVDARLNGKPTPAGLSPDVVMERHYALNWLIGYMNQEWDDVTTDT